MAVDILGYAIFYFFTAEPLCNIPTFFQEKVDCSRILTFFFSFLGACSCSCFLFEPSTGGTLEVLLTWACLLNCLTSSMFPDGPP